MSNILLPNEHTAIKAFMAANSSLGTDAAVFTAINNPSQVANSTSPQILEPFQPNDILGLVSSASMEKIKTEVTMPLSDLNKSILANDRVTLGMAAQLYLSFSDITQSEYNAIAARLALIYSDPLWPATVAGPRWIDTNLLTNGKRSDGSTAWTDHDGSSYSFVPMSGITEART